MRHSLGDLKPTCSLIQFESREADHLFLGPHRLVGKTRDWRIQGPISGGKASGKHAKKKAHGKKTEKREPKLIDDRHLGMAGKKVGVEKIDRKGKEKKKEPKLIDDRHLGMAGKNVGVEKLDSKGKEEKKEPKLIDDRHFGMVGKKDPIKADDSTGGSAGGKKVEMSPAEGSAPTASL